MRSYKLKLWGFSGGLVAKSPPVNAGDTGSIPNPKDPTGMEQLSPCATIIEPVL